MGTFATPLLGVRDDDDQIFLQHFFLGPLLNRRMSNFHSL